MNMQDARRRFDKATQGYDQVSFLLSFYSLKLTLFLIFSFEVISKYAYELMRMLACVIKAICLQTHTHTCMYLCNYVCMEFQLLVKKICQRSVRQVS